MMCICQTSYLKRTADIGIKTTHVINTVISHARGVCD